MIKQSVCIWAALLSGAAALSAQNTVPAPSQARQVFVSLQGGPVLDIYENAFSYRENGRTLDLFTLQGAFSIGYEINDVYGLRLQAGIGKDAGACNVRQTSGGGFYPYSFRHVAIFADVLLNLNGLAGKITAFRPKLYAGVGGAHTYGFSDAKHPWQKVNGKNTIPGFRGGFIAEYSFPSGLGFFADLGGEAYHDMYNGLMPTKEEQKNYEGYGGFPLDLRAALNFGIVYHFK
ncbi:MAG: hypothetical protein IKW89_12965 [Bacteroidales bacterium]|nr:hypothetical protein [Bacteroidales bacterium]